MGPFLLFAILEMSLLDASRASLRNKCVQIIPGTISAGTISAGRVT